MKNQIMFFIQKALFEEFTNACKAGIISQKWEIYSLYEKAGACDSAHQNTFMNNLRIRLGQEDFNALIKKGKDIVSREKSATICELLSS